MARPTTGRVTGAPCPLGNYSTDRSIEVEDLTRKEQTWLLSALHVLKVDFAESDATRSDFRFGYPRVP